MGKPSNLGNKIFGRPIDFYPVKKKYYDEARKWLLNDKELENTINKIYYRYSRFGRKPKF